MPAARRQYHQFCPVARALDYVGERWTLLLVRELMLGPRRFKDLLEGLPGIATNLLATRLKDMERDGLVTRRVLPPPAGSTVYELTEMGRGLEPVVFALGRWGHQFLLSPDPDDAARPGWFITSLRASFHPEAVRRRREIYELWVDGEQFHVRIDRGDVRASQGGATDPDVVLSTDVQTLRNLLAGTATPAGAHRNGKVKIKGDVADLQRFVNAFRWQQAARRTVADPAQPR